MTSFADLRHRTDGWHRPAVRVAAGFAAIAVITAVAMLIDRRDLLGSPVWAKPFKFAVSGALYFLTWGWLVSLLPRFRRTAYWLTNILIALFAAEYVLIVVQAARGRASHFNNATPVESTIFVVMGVIIAGLWVATLILTVLLTFSRQADRSNFWAVRLGAVLAFVGISLGALMVGPTAQQAAALRDTGTSPVIGAHTVGLADGGPGLPILGWSTVGGDLRIPHFVGMHALQALPLLALALAMLARRFPRLRPDAVRARLVLTGAAGYAGLIALVTWQAERGQSIVRPDGLTLAAAATLLGATIIAVVVSVRSRPQVMADVPVEAVAR